ncbi:MAG: hypothetical protein AAF488_12280 [Planctomycetota bacterium]
MLQSSWWARSDADVRPEDVSAEEWQQKEQHSHPTPLAGGMTGGRRARL